MSGAVVDYFAMTACHIMFCNLFKVWVTASLPPPQKKKIQKDDKHNTQYSPKINCFSFPLLSWHASKNGWR